MEKEKKVYTPPIAEPIMLVPSEEVAATVGDAQSENWVPDGWQNKFQNQSTVQAFGKWVWNEDGTITGN